MDEDTISNFINALSQLLKILEFWNCIDKRLEINLKPVTETFCFRLYTKVLPQIKQILKKIQTDFITTKEMLQNYFVNDLFRNLEDILDQINENNHQIVVINTIQLLSRIINVSIMKIQLFIQDQGNKIYISLINIFSPFVASLNQFQQKLV